MPATIQNSVVTYPPFPIVPEPEKVVIANAYNVKAQSYRENKEEQFIGLINETMQSTATHLKNNVNTEVAIERDSFFVNRDPYVDSLLIKHNASHVLLITHFDAYFVQTDVEVTETETGKSREAFYDIVVDIGYLLQSQYDQKFDTIISARRQHSSRSVLSGLLAAGPNIVSNQEDALEGVHVNTELLMRCFTRGSETKTRTLYVSKEFEAVDDAIEAMDYAGAFAVSEKLANAKDPKIASMAYYNCAVLLERMGTFEKVKVYLEESLRLRPGFADAQVMLEDYRFQPKPAK
jgi:hypothetical protein